MIHADVEVAGFKKLEQARAEDLEFFHAFGKVRGERALLFFQPRNVGVAEEGDAIGSELNDFIHRVCEAVGRLIGQAVDQVDVDAVEAEIASGEEQVARHFERLNAVDGFLHFGVKILNAHAEAVEAELAQGFEMLARGDPRVDFDADFGIRRKMEMFASETEEILDLRGRQVGGRAAAPMELHDGTVFRNTAADALRLALEDAKIGRRNRFVLLDDDVARAKKAEAFAERDVHVERDRRFRAFRFFVHSYEVVRAESVIPNGRGGIARIAGAGAIVFGEEFLSDAELFAHFLQAWMSESHRGDSLPCLRGGPRILKENLLAGFNEELGILNGCVL